MINDNLAAVKAPITGGDGDNLFRQISPDKAVNLQFSDITYQVEGESSDQALKTILNNVSGEFRAGELSAIIGPSGSGKTTLLNILTGNRLKPNSGQTYVNGRLRNMATFRKMSRYVLQEDHISPYFTVMETLMMASNFKLDSSYTKEQRQTVINELLDNFKMSEVANTRILKLSGGQRKRVCVSLELLNNPAVLFLDEPTTGLDEVSAYQCLMMLQKLAMSGRTVICSIHTPSYRLFQMFDHIYTLAEGECIYQGPANYIVHYVEYFNLKCPITYNPADFIIEVATHVYGNFHEDMVHAMDNGKVIKWSPDVDVASGLPQHQRILELSAADTHEMASVQSQAGTSWWSEYKWLLQRIAKQVWRDKVNLNLRIFVHIFLASIIGFAYTDVGRNARIGIYNYHLTLVTVVLCVFMPMMPVLPFIAREMKYLKREHFNQWYRISSYFMAVLTSQFVMLCIMSIVASAILYLLSDQPMQLFRFVLFTGIVFLTSLVTNSFGLFVGSRFCLVNALFISPAVMAVYIMLANYATERPELTTFEKIAMYSSCLRYAVEGLLAALFGYNRPNLVCPNSEVFCLMTRPRFLLKLVGSENLDYFRSAATLMAFYLVFSALAFLNFRSRLMGKRMTHLQFKNIVTKYFCFKKC